MGPAQPKGGNEKLLFLGTIDVALGVITRGRFEVDIALRIVDVAPLHIKVGKVGDHVRTTVEVFTGDGGHGTSTGINACISYLLGGDLEDPAHVLVIDERGAKQHGSVTQTVFFRI